MGLRSVIIYGPPKSGKTTNGQKLVNHFGMYFLIDGWDGKKFNPRHTLYLTNMTPKLLEKYSMNGHHVVAISDALNEIQRLNK